MQGSPNRAVRQRARSTASSSISGLKRRTTLLVVTYLAVPAALAGSDLVATVPRRVAELIAATARVAVTPLPIDFALTVSMAWHRRAATDPAQSWFRSLLIEAAAA
jgi:DNA-binding transcriptional LysR family regulator